MSDAVSLFIIVFTLVNILACLWLMWWTARSRSQIQGTGENKTGHVWDGDLEEYNNPLPRWWLGLFIITVIFGLGYLVFYPGLGSFSGTSGWSQVAQYEAQKAKADATFAARLEPLAHLSLAELSKNDDAMAMAKNLFGNTCSTCHGSDARGARSFPNLTDGDWLWGGAEQTVYETIANGRTGVMPPWGPALGVEGVNEVAAYVLSLGGRKVPQDWIAKGKVRYDMLCVACHGPDGKGSLALGAPNLTDEVWLHGGDLETVRDVITHGRNNQMPAHLPLVGEARVRLLAAYVLSFHHDTAEAVAKNTQ